jgi:hypothetical protein
MHTNHLKRALFLVLSFSLAMPAIAEPPPWAGKGKGRDNGEERDDHRAGVGENASEQHFSHVHRVAVHDYYNHEFQGRGKCPPGLAKKHNGCMPPGQARKWQMGQPLPSDVVVYPIPHTLEVKIGLPPAGYKYVRVASDILMIAVGSSVVADAIKDLGKI